jgi:elongation of very long chain fatty acids protein 4
MSYVAGGACFFPAALNSLVHVVMYSYYLWSSFAPRIPSASAKVGPTQDKEMTLLGNTSAPATVSFKITWTHPAFYKQYITRFQLIQFVLIGIHSYYVYKQGHNITPPFTLMVIGYMVTMLILFGNFYLQNYLKKGKSKEKAE